MIEWTKLKEFDHLAVEGIELEIEDGCVKSIIISTDGGPLKIRQEAYSSSMSLLIPKPPETIELWCVSIQHVNTYFEDREDAVVWKNKVDPDLQVSSAKFLEDALPDYIKSSIEEDDDIPF